MIAASLVLVATAAFVLQGPALAQGHRHADAPCQTGSADTAAHSHDFSSCTFPRRSRGSLHDQVATDHAAEYTEYLGHDHASANADSCCGKFCSAIVCVVSPQLASVKFELKGSPTVESQVPEGIGPSGLKRPPRTLGLT